MRLVYHLLQMDVYFIVKWLWFWENIFTDESKHLYGYYKGNPKQTNFILSIFIWLPYDGLFSHFDLYKSVWNHMDIRRTLRVVFYHFFFFLKRWTINFELWTYSQSSRDLQFTSIYNKYKSFTWKFVDVNSQPCSFKASYNFQRMPNKNNIRPIFLMSLSSLNKIPK